MAAVRRFTRSQKTTTPDDLTDNLAHEPQPRSLRSSKAASTDTKLKSENTKNTEKAKRQSLARKRTRVDNGDVNKDKEESRAKKTRATQKKNETGKRVSMSRKGKEAQSTSKQRTAKKSVVFTDESSTLSEVESEDQESSSDSKSESGMASGYTSSSSLSSASQRESDSPVPTSDLSDSLNGIESSSDDSSSSEDVLRWRTRKSPRKLAQAKSREKIAELCKPESDDTLSTSSSDSSYSE